MNMIYKNDTLYIDMIGNVDGSDIRQLKRRLFSVLDQYEVDNVVINVKSVFNLNKNLMNSLIKEYHRNYKGNLTIDTK